MPVKETLDTFYREFNAKERLVHDPVSFVRRYRKHEDREVAGFTAACFAYGKVTLFMPVIEKILGPGQHHPAAFFRNFSVKRDAGYFRNIRYRFNKEDDILCFIYFLSMALKKWGSLKQLFYHFYRKADQDIRGALIGYSDYFLHIDSSPVYGENVKPYGLLHLFPSPARGGACKRMNLFLRWMVRKDDIDVGIWDRIPHSQLIIPLDTHIVRIARCLGLTGRSSSDWNTAKEITASLSRFDPNDPLKYDFALCHHGISGLCKGKKVAHLCSSCVLWGKSSEIKT